VNKHISAAATLAAVIIVRLPRTLRRVH
jgi:hypothetical protein